MTTISVPFEQGWGTFSELVLWTVQKVMDDVEGAIFRQDLVLLKPDTGPAGLQKIVFDADGLDAGTLFSTAAAWSFVNKHPDQLCKA